MAIPLKNFVKIDYLTSEQLKYGDVITIKQLRDCALAVHKKTNVIAISEMFCTEIKLQQIVFFNGIIII